MVVRKTLHGILTILLFGSLFPAISSAQHHEILSGKVVDARTNEPLPYSTVYLKKQASGTLTDELGNFQILLKEETFIDSLQIISLGYKNASIEISSAIPTVLVALEPSVSELSEVVVRPMPPTYYIKRAMKAIPEIKMRDAFRTEGYYAEKIVENHKVIKFDEGIFHSYHPSNNDSIRKKQFQLVLFRKPEKLHEMMFMKAERHKMEEKEKRKDPNKEVYTGIDFIFVSGGPQNMLHYATIHKSVDPYLDSNEFKHYEYSFASSTNDGDLLVIDFNSKGVVDHVKQEGKIYIHLPSNAILKVEGQGRIVVPLLLKPLMFLYGFSTQELMFRGKKEYQIINGKWFFKSSTISAHAGVTKRHLFSSNEHADYDGMQSYTILKIYDKQVTPIEPSKRYNPEKLMDGQVFKEEGIDWPLPGDILK